VVLFCVYICPLDGDHSVAGICRTTVEWRLILIIYISMQSGCKIIKFSSIRAYLRLNKHTAGPHAATYYAVGTALRVTAWRYK
jgi:hypothetical protein